METDYKELCYRLFGTVDVDELESIAKKLANYGRNAGRKGAIDTQTKAKICAALSRGEEINDIANRLGLTRQTVSRYMNAPPAEGYTMRMEYMFRTKPCTLIDVNFLDEKVMIQNRTDDILCRAFGNNLTPTWEDFNSFLIDRCPSKTNGNIKSILKKLDLSDYDPLQIIERTQGRTADDPMWLRFKYYDRGGKGNA